jgi:IS1 family transposase
MISMNRLPLDRRAEIIGMIAEGNSLRSTSRMADVSINTVTKLLVEVGAACSAYQDRVFRNLRLKRIQCDEIWSFVYAKQKNVTPSMLERGHAGDVWTWTALDAETKLVPSWRVGSRDAHTAAEFIEDLASRLATRVQLTTDGYKPYLSAVEGALGADVDYAMLVKLYSQGGKDESRYSPAECIGAIPTVVSGAPDPKHVSTSYAERQNLTMRMCMRRFTRLTNAFSKKLENHAAAVALYFMYYNFARIHKSLRVTPSMAAGVSDHIWSLSEIANLLAGKRPNT